MLKRCVICEGDFIGKGNVNACSEKCSHQRLLDRKRRFRIEHRESILEYARNYYLSGRRDDYRRDKGKHAENQRRYSRSEKVLRQKAELRAALQIVRQLQQGIMP